jgi:predicted CoA-binding protein
MTAMSQIQDFLGQKRLAIVGVSRTSQDFSRAVFCEFCLRGYDASPVNPEAAEIDGQPCFHHLQEIQPPIENVLLITPLP